MSSPRARSALRRLAGAAAAGILAVASVFALAAPAWAHDELLTTDPADGATVAALPARITLTFSGAVATDLGGNQVQVTDATGAPLADGEPVVADNVVTQALTGAVDGEVAVVWRVVSEDGHPISGEFSFAVEGSPPTPSPTPTQNASAAPVPTSTQIATPSPDATPVAATTPASPVPAIVLGAVLIAAIAGVVVLLVLRGRRPPSAPIDPNPDR